LLQQVERGLDGASLQTPVTREHQGAAGKRTGIREGGRIKGRRLLREGAKTRSIVRPTDGRKLQTDRADVQADVDAHDSRCQVSGARCQVSGVTEIRSSQELWGILSFPPTTYHLKPVVRVKTR